MTTRSEAPAPTLSEAPADAGASADPTPAAGDSAAGDSAAGDSVAGDSVAGDSVAGDRRPRFGTAWVALAIVIGLLLGFAAGLLAPGLVRPGDASAEAGFARDMSTHHAQAVELAMLAHVRATDPDVRTLGGDIALTQQGQIGVMQTWLRNWKLNPTSSEPKMAWMPGGTATLREGLMPGMATDAERAQLRAASGRDFDILFLRLMRTHHLGGIHMAEGVLDLTDDEQVRALAESMVAGQQKELEVIGALLGKLGAS